MTSSLARVELSFTPLAEHVRTARMVAVAFSRRAGLPHDLIDEVRLAVGEAAARAVTLNAGGDRQPVRLLLGEDDGRLQVTVCDSGSSGSTPAPQSAATAGDQLADLGDAADADSVSLAVLHGLVDDLTVAANPDGGTEVRLSWPTGAGRHGDRL